MSPTSCRCSTPRRADAKPASFHPCRGWEAPAAASPPGGSPPQYSPALRGVTTGFGMGPGGARALSATNTAHPPLGGQRDAATPAICAIPREREEDPNSVLSTRPRALHVLSCPCGAAYGASAEEIPRSGAGRLGESIRHTAARCCLRMLRPRPLGRLGSSRLPAVHRPPIDPVICRGSYLSAQWGGWSWGGIPA